MTTAALQPVLAAGWLGGGLVLVVPAAAVGGIRLLSSATSTGREGAQAINRSKSNRSAAGRLGLLNRIRVLITKSVGDIFLCSKVARQLWEVSTYLDWLSMAMISVMCHRLLASRSTVNSNSSVESG